LKTESSTVKGKRLKAWKLEAGRLGGRIAEK